MQEKKLLRLYYEEIENGEVKKEDLLEYNIMLELNFRTQRLEIIKIMEKTSDLHTYFLKNLYFPKMPLYWAMVNISTDEDETKYDRVK
ncbi:hypothetical protein [Flavobacterium sp.]|uniref:hypothetical protein n=1 Tax=Flavobacterium sp. TaxID=239 RepID=UPI003752E684